MLSTPNRLPFSAILVHFEILLSDLSAMVLILGSFDDHMKTGFLLVVASACCKSKHFDISHTPNLSADSRLIDQFYNQLKTLVGKLSRLDGSITFGG